MSANIPVTARDRGYRPQVSIETQFSQSQNEKIHLWFLEKFGADGEELFNRYTGIIPPRILWKKQRPYFRIPSGFFDSSPEKKFGSINRNYPVYSNGQVCCFEKYLLAEVNNGEYELRVYFEPVSRGELVNQQHIIEDREQQKQHDGDIFLRERGLDLAVSKKYPEVCIPELEFTTDELNLEIRSMETPVNMTVTEEFNIQDSTIKTATISNTSRKTSTVRLDSEKPTNVSKRLWRTFIDKISAVLKVILAFLKSWLIQSSDSKDYEQNNELKKPLLKDNETTNEYTTDSSSGLSDQEQETEIVFIDTQTQSSDDEDALGFFL